jgi:hypothetical protein
MTQQLTSQLVHFLITALKNQNTQLKNGKVHYSLSFFYFILIALSVIVAKIFDEIQNFDQP